MSTERSSPRAIFRALKMYYSSLSLIHWKLWNLYPRLSFFLSLCLILPEFGVYTEKTAKGMASNWGPHLKSYSVPLYLSLQLPRIHW